MEAILEAVKRSTKGKNEARRLRAAGKIPAVLYGAQKAGDPPAPEQVAVDPKPFMRILHSASGFNTLITLKVQDGTDARVLVKNVQLDPITHHLLHADFFRVNMDRKLKVTVPITLKGEARGVKVDGGVLDFVRVDGRLRFAASLPAANKTGLKLSSKLLSVASKVVEETP